MAATSFHRAIGTIPSCGYFNNTCGNQENGNASLKLISKGFRLDVAMLRTGTYHSKKQSFCVIQAMGSQTTVFDPVLSPLNGTPSDSKKKSNEAALILIRHGESMWNEKNLFTGCVDVPLTKKGVDEAIEAGKRISNIPVDMIYTSSLIRAQMTAMLAMTEHRRKKVPLILHDESDQARAWSQIFSEETNKHCIPVVTAWQLNERMYGELQGLNKQETADRYGKEQVHEWRRSYDVPPPDGESLEMCAERAVAYFRENIEPQLLLGKNVMIAAHGNSLRSIIMLLDWNYRLGYQCFTFLKRGDLFVGVVQWHQLKQVFMLTLRVWPNTGKSWMRSSSHKCKKLCCSIPWKTPNEQKYYPSLYFSCP